MFHPVLLLNGNLTSTVQIFKVWIAAPLLDMHETSEQTKAVVLSLSGRKIDRPMLAYIVSHLYRCTSGRLRKLTSSEISRTG